MKCQRAKVEARIQTATNEAPHAQNRKNKNTPHAQISTIKTIKGTLNANIVTTLFVLPHY